MTEDPIKQILEELLNNPDIHACMIARQNMITIIPDTNNFNPEIHKQWDIIKNTINDTFQVIKNYSTKGLTQITLTINQYQIIFDILPETENALVTITPKNNTKQIHEITQNAKQKIQKQM